MQSEQLLLLNLKEFERIDTRSVHLYYFCLRKPTHKKLDSIKLKNIRVYAFHGCLVEESKIGSDYIVNLEVKADLSHASKSDSLHDTVDYVQLQTIVKDEMATRSKLLEHVARRIMTSVLQKIERVSEVKVSVAKVNPPIGGDVAEVSVSMKMKR